MFHVVGPVALGSASLASATLTVAGALKARASLREKQRQHRTTHARLAGLHSMSSGTHGGALLRR